MKRLSNMLWTDTNRAFHEVRFYLACFLFVLSRLVVVMPEFRGFVHQGLSDRIYQSGYLYFSSFFLTSPLSGFAIAVSCLPFAAAYLEDRRSGFDLYSLSRSNIKSYAVSKMLVNLLMSMLTAFIGYMVVNLIFIGLTKGHPGAVMQGAGDSAIYRLSVRQPVAYLLLLSWLNALYCAFWSLFAQLISAMIQNIYLIIAITYAGQLVLSYSHLSLIGIMVLHNTHAFEGGWLVSENISMTLGLGLNLLQFAVLYLILIALFVRRVKKQYEG